jgi:vacuolar-type H+-ATPase subunit I/STV1
LQRFRLVSRSGSFYIGGMKSRYQIATLILSALLCAPATHALEKRYYRYTNLEGNVVIDDRAPRDYAGEGYEIINGKGVVLESVPRPLSGEERAAQLAAERQQAEALKRDKNLLLRYSTIEDIEAAKERSLRELEIRIGILKSNRTGLKNKIERLQQQAADLERQGRDVGPGQLKVMDDAREELLRTEKNLASRKAERNAVAADFDSDIERFGELLELVEWRRQREHRELH